jgi:hypothetical protein
MNVIFYSGRAKKAAAEIERIIEMFVPGKLLKTFNRLDAFTLWLNKSSKWGEKTVLVLIAGDKKELSALVELIDLFQNHSFAIILILPDHDNDSISMGHKLTPRYLSYIDSDFTEVGAVLDKILGNSKNK